MTKRAYPKPPPATGAEAVLREYALAFDDVVEEFPWGHRAMKVRGKIFVIFGGDADALRIATKLPRTGKTALERPNCEPTPYGMGKHGWVTSIWPPFQEPDVDLVKGWLAESYEAIAASTRGKSTPRGASKKATPKRATKVAKSVRVAKPVVTRSAATRTATMKTAGTTRAAAKSPAKLGSSKSRQPSRKTRSTKTRR